ncbi:GNL2 [Mytilus edulis]|uniref:NUG2 n=1 Tax=Mytilus edulis TaxID=6550 RepID=A0A8S3Q479_MYTED|nr:GNL2 [Mytilus edulis]
MRKNFSREDAGLYRCDTAVNGRTTDHLIKVRVAEPPRNLEVANSNEVNIVFTHEGSKITLTCTVEQGIPSGNISWYNGNTKLASNTSSIVRYGFHITRNDHKLGLACEASNSFYTARKTIHLHIYNKPFISEGSTKYKYESEKGKVTNISIAVGSQNAPRVAWTTSHGGKQGIWTVNRILFDTFRLTSTIVPYGLNDYREYGVRIRNTVGSIDLNVELVRFTVQVYPISTFCNTSKRISFTCNISSKNATWLRNEWIHIYKGSVIRTITGKVENNLSMMTITYCDYRDAGTYMCKWESGTELYTDSSSNYSQCQKGKCGGDIHVSDLRGSDKMIISYGPISGVETRDCETLGLHCQDQDLERGEPEFRKENIEVIFRAGQSKRVWNELYKVIDSSDVVVQVLDARDPMGTRCYQVERYMKKEKPHKHLMFVLNKVDLIPVWVTQKWVAILSSEHPTMAFHASITNPFGKGAMITLLRQFAKLHSDKKQISVGFIGYPNVGKSSIINTLKAKKVCKVAPLAGETKVWQYVALMRRIYLVDCPGVVYPTAETPTEFVLKGVVRIENVKTPEDYIEAMLKRVKTDYIKTTYSLISWDSHEDFLEQICRKSGRLLKRHNRNRPIKRDHRIHDNQGQATPLGDIRISGITVP